MAREFNLNPQQRQAVNTIDGPLLVIAGPGTGKTQLLSMRVAHILKTTDANPSNILCLTFTEAAARNMRERLVELIGEPAYHVGIYTFHGFGSDIIQRYPEYFMDQPLLKPVDDLGAYELLLDIFSSIGHSNPLQQKLGDDYLHLHSAQIAIGWLKKAGLEPNDLRLLAKENHAFIAFAEPLIEKVFRESPSSQQLKHYKILLSQTHAYQKASSLRDLFVKELELAISQVNSAKRHAPSVTAWRNKWLVQNQSKTWIMADRRRNKFLQALEVVYQRYQQALAERGWYTYDDMILRTIHALQTEPELRLGLQEQYQYIMVDEYQDTNGAQNKLLELLADNPVNEGRPNLMVVGDDDQGIYRFQGAELSIMADFLQRWPTVEQVVLTANYRAGKPLLDVARGIIKQGEDRLENQVAGINKELVAANVKTASRLSRPQTVSELEQYAYVAEQIAALLKAGSQPEQIAVLAPKHSYLRSLVPFLLDKNIPVSYERREHILSQPRIVELLNLARLVQAAAAGDWPAVDALMPTVLAAEYWQLDPKQVWQLSLDSYKDKKLWVEVMASHKNKTIRHLAEALPLLSQQSLTQPLDTMLDMLIGNQPVDGSWRIPYRQYYFSQQQLEQNTQEYFTLLGQLSTLRSSLREYRPGQPLTLESLLEFVDLYQKSNLTLLDTNPHTSAAAAVELMTAYKAKGLEWDTVFVLGTHNDIWGSKARSRNYSFGLTSNLAWIKPARDSSDDRLRLFYVALTRARQQLVMTSFQQSLNGKGSEQVSWFAKEIASLPPVTTVKTHSASDLIHAQEVNWGLSPPQRRSLADSLQPFLANYQLSATHFNSFFDLARGGPKHFFFRHMLHFPEAVTASSVYGSAIHEILHFMHSQLTKHGRLPKAVVINKLLADAITASALLPSDKERLLERGQAALHMFQKQAVQQFKPSDKSEYNFAKEGVVLGQAHLTGKVDVLRQLGQNRLAIIDYKTGAALTSWRPKGPNSQIRAHLYQQQLGFYHYLVKGSAHFGSQTVDQLSLQFVEPDEDGNLQQLDYRPSAEELDRLARLISVVWQRIMKLDFPDTSLYRLTLSGVKKFEDDLLDKKI